MSVAMVLLNRRAENGSCRGFESGHGPLGIQART
jgi:hypothetical protein